MRAANLKELGFNWTYWVMGLLFAGMFIAMAVALVVTKTGQKTFAGFGGFFFVITSLVVAWPLWRIHEPQRVRFARIWSGKRQFDGMLVGVSLAKRVVLLVGGFALFVSAAIFLSDPANQNRAKMWLALIFFGGYSIVWAWAAFRRTFGILLTEQGIVWHQIFQAPAFLPWNSIFQCAVFIKRERYTSGPCLGIAVTDVNRIETSAHNRLERESAREADGCHFHEDAEMLLAPTEIVASAIEFYRTNPNFRHELATGAAAERFESFAETSRTADAIKTSVVPA